MSTLRDVGFNKRRVIDGIRVLVREEANGTGIIQDNFLIRIKNPSGDIDMEMTAHYYWQVFDAVQKMWPTLVQRITKV